MWDTYIQQAMPTKRNLRSERKESETAQKGREFVQAERKCDLRDMA